MESRVLLTKTTFGQGGFGPSIVSPFVQYNGAAYFTYSRETTGVELWRTDGTQQGTSLVKDIVPGPGSSGPEGLTILKGYLYFFATNSEGDRQLYKTDGTEAGTVVAATLPVSSSGGAITIGSTIFFAAANNNDWELYKTDGSTGGTTLVKDIRTGNVSSNPGGFLSFNGLLFFTADDGVHGRELWRSDGTEVGTFLVKDLTPGSFNSSILNYFTEFNGRLYFTLDENGEFDDVYSTDGTTEGTVLESDPPIEVKYTAEFTPGNDGNYFYLEKRYYGDQERLYVSDGVNRTLLRTASYNEFQANLAFVNGFLLFAAKNENGVELWRSDGTPEGTEMLKDIRPGTVGVQAYSSYPSLMKVVGNEVYFVANDGIHGMELWKTDGTPEGTMLVKDAIPGSRGSYISPLDEVNGALLFITYDSIQSYVYWGTDGTESGTNTLINLNDAPVLKPAGNPALAPIPQDVSNGANTGTLISSIISSMSPGGITDIDFGSLRGIAVFGTDQRFGVWQYSIDGGTTWLNIGNAAVSNARLLASDSSTKMRFVPQTGYNGIARFTFIAWDQTTGINGDVADTSEAGGTTAFSIASDEAKIIVGSPNKSATFGVFRNGTFYLDANRNRNWDGTSGDSSFGFGLSTDLPVAGDWDGDSRTDVGVFRNGVFYLDANGSRTWNGTSGGDASFNFGTAGDTPLTGDWNGDGKTEVGIWRNGMFYLDQNGNRQWDGLEGGDLRFGFGSVADTPITGDWNGDGITDVGVYRAGTFYLDQNGNRKWDGTINGDAQFGFAAATDLPVTGDWNGDGKTDVGVFRSGKFYLDLNHNQRWDGPAGGDYVKGFSAPTDIPIIGTWGPKNVSSPSSVTAAPLESILDPSLSSLAKKLKKRRHGESDG
ncbi:MAG: hypothetical protein KDA68_08805 [Planctomycetaceae bacterium]|nr:hypothetical protein [Planctomycetaceae bacterium]